jgi:uncharacterized protein
VAHSTSTSGYHAAEVQFAHHDTVLAGLLLRPPGQRPHPAVVLLHNSGPVGRDGPGYLPPIREHFARHGIAALCYDKPGIGGSTGDWTTQTFDDRAAEALAAIAFLQQQPQIDPARIGLWGASQGGWIGPLAATRSSDIAYVIAVSGPGIGVADQNAYAVEHMLRLNGFPQSQIEQAGHRRPARGAAGPRRDQRGAASQRTIAHEPWFAHFGEDSEAELRFMQGILDYDPVPILESVRCPLLGIWGAGDLLVPAHRSAAVFAAALAKAHNQQFRLEVFPGADHRIAVIEHGTGREQVQWSPARRFAPGYLETMTGWLHQSVFHTDNTQ